MRDQRITGSLGLPTISHFIRMFVATLSAAVRIARILVRLIMSISRLRLSDVFPTHSGRSETKRERRDSKVREGRDGERQDSKDNARCDGLVVVFVDREELFRRWLVRWKLVLEAELAELLLQKAGRARVFRSLEHTTFGRFVQADVADSEGISKCEDSEGQAQRGAIDLRVVHRGRIECQQDRSVRIRNRLTSPAS